MYAYAIIYNLFDVMFKSLPKLACNTSFPVSKCLCVVRSLGSLIDCRVTDDDTSGLTGLQNAYCYATNTEIFAYCY